MTAPTLAQIDGRLAQLRTTLERTTENLVELDADVTRQMLDASSCLAGETARDWAVASSQIAGLWQGQLALNDVLEALSTERGIGASVRRATLLRIAEQLDGCPVVLSPNEAHPALTDGLHKSVAYSIDDVLAMMSFAFDAATSTLRTITSVWSETVPRLQSLEAALTAVARGSRGSAADARTSLPRSRRGSLPPWSWRPPIRWP